MRLAAAVALKGVPAARRMLRAAVPTLRGPHAGTSQHTKATGRAAAAAPAATLLNSRAGGSAAAVPFRDSSSGQAAARGCHLGRVVSR